MEALIEKIHSEFMTSADKTLLTAKKFADSYVPAEKKLNEDVDFLKNIGFCNVDFVKETTVHNENVENENRKNAIKLANQKAESERILDLQTKYPNYKVLTYDSMQYICDKYNLICSVSKYYTGSIPNKSVKELQEFVKNVNIDDSEKVSYERQRENFKSFYVRLNVPLSAERKKLLKDYENWPELMKTSYIPDDCDMMRCYCVYEPRFYFSDDEDNFESGHLMKDFLICAPPKDFDFKNFWSGHFIHAKNNKLLQGAKNAYIPDPVIMYPVKGANKKPMFLIATVWGIEKYDPLLKDNPFDEKFEMN